MDVNKIKNIKFKKRYVVYGILLVYLLITIIKFIGLEYNLHKRYGKVANTFIPIMVYKNSEIVNTIRYITLLPFMPIFGFEPYIPYYTNYDRINELHVKFITLYTSKPFEVYYNKNEIVKDTFYDVLSTDSKLQHLYSDYIKEQIGLDDENIEMEFKGAVKYGQRVGDEPTIDFSKINANENINEQICKNLKNLYLTRVYVNNCTMNQKEDILNYAIELEKKLKKYVFADGEKQLYFEINLKNDVISQYYILFDYNNNTRKYSIYDKNWNATDWQTF